jgi:hypothetical protein
MTLNQSVKMFNQSQKLKTLNQLIIRIIYQLISSRDEIRKMITPKDQYIAQRAREAYIVIVSQFEASFDLLFAAQIINLKEEDAKRLNQRLQ